MWYIIEDEERIELELGSTDIFDYEGETIFSDDEDTDIDAEGVEIDDTFIIQWDWFEDHEDWDKIHAYYKNMGGDLQDAFDKWEEAYQGEFDDDEEFAYDLAEQLGAIDKKAIWPNTCIDWEQAAEEIMYDYFESDGFYFRNL